MRKVTKENLIVQIDRLHKIKDEQGQLSMSGEYTLQAYEMLLATMEVEPVVVVPDELKEAVTDFLIVLDEYPEQLVPINRDSAVVRTMRAAMLNQAPIKQPDSELEKAKRCLPYHLDDRYKVNGSWIGSVQNYIVTLEQKLEENGIDIDGEDDE